MIIISILIKDIVIDKLKKTLDPKLFKVFWAIIDMQPRNN